MACSDPSATPGPPPAKAAIKDFIKPSVLAFRTRQKQEEELNDVLRNYVATQEARLLG